MVQTIIGFLLGAASSLAISYYFYKKSGKEMDNYVEELKNENKELRSENEKLHKNVRLQMERQFKLDKGEEAFVIKKGGDYGLRTTNTFKGSLTVVAQDKENTSQK